MVSTAKSGQENVISLEKYRSRRVPKGPTGLAHEQVMGDPDPPTARVWLQNGAPQAALQNIQPDSAAQLLILALSMCIELAVIAQNTPAVAYGIDTFS